jgi:hypothetical protein
MRAPATLGKFANGTPCLIELPRLLETRLLIQANSGSGKSWAIRELLEQTAGHVQQLVIDPEGEFSTLREKFDYVIAAAHDGDALAHPQTAKLLAHRLLETGVSAILDIYDLKKPDRQAFVKLFCEALIEAPKSLWRPALVVLDEAHIYAPEKGKAEAAGAVIDLATRGRKRGFCLIAATQRLAKLHKDVAAELFNKLVGRTGLDVDVKRAADELGMTTREATPILRALAPGEFFVFGPAFSATVERVNIGSVKTTHPRAGDRVLKAPPKPTNAIRAVLPKLADLRQAAETEARTLDEMRSALTRARQELKEAQRKLKAPPGLKATIAAAPAVALKATIKQLQTAQATGYTEGFAAARGGVVKIERQLRLSLHAAIDQTLKTLPALCAAQAPAQGALQSAPANTRQIAAAAAVTASRVLPKSSPVARAPVFKLSANPPDADSPVSGPEQRILDALSWLETMTGISASNQAAVAFLAGYTIGGGGYNNPRGRLNSRGLVRYLPSGKLELTDEGRGLAKASAAPLTRSALHQTVLARLPGPEGRILTPLLEIYPDSMEGTKVAEAAGYTFGAGGFNNPRGRLRSLGLIDYVGNGHLVATDALFPEGLE